MDMEGGMGKISYGEWEKCVQDTIWLELRF